MFFTRFLYIKKKLLIHESNQQTYVISHFLVPVSKFDWYNTSFWKIFVMWCTYKYFYIHSHRYYGLRLRLVRMYLCIYEFFFFSKNNYSMTYI